MSQPPRVALIIETSVSVSVYESAWRGSDTPRWDEDMEKIERWLAGLPQPLALMACNDVRGLHILDACTRLGILVPEQVAVVGVDNDEIVCELCTPPLSSVEPDPERIGYAAAELLDRLMARRASRPERISIDPVRVTPGVPLILWPSKTASWPPPCASSGNRPSGAAALTTSPGICMSPAASWNGASGNS